MGARNGPTQDLVKSRPTGREVKKDSWASGAPNWAVAQACKHQFTGVGLAGDPANQ
jgi:hypothetical protein